MAKAHAQLGSQALLGAQIFADAAWGARSYLMSGRHLKPGESAGVSPLAEPVRSLTPDEESAFCETACSRRH
jgi:hypothetical protein